MRKLAALVMLLCLSASAFASQEFDPEARLKEINEWFAAELKSRTDRDKPYPLFYGDIVRFLQRERKSRVRKMIEGVTPETIAAEKSLAMAELYCHAEMPKEKSASARRFLTTKPEGARAYAAQKLILQTYTRPSDAKAITELMRQVHPIRERDALMLLNDTSTRFRRLIAGELGPEAALKALDHVKTLVPFDRITKDHAEAGLAENALVNFSIARAELLMALERREEARKTLADAKPRITPGTINAKMLNDAVVSLGFAR